MEKKEGAEDEYEPSKELEEFTKEELMKKVMRSDKLIKKRDIIIQELLEENERLSNFIHENITTNWSWDKIREEFLKIEDLSEATSYLWKVLREKAICTTKECPVFPSLNEVSNDLFNMHKDYGETYSLKTARYRFEFNQEKLNRWKKEYWTIKYKLNLALQEIAAVGIPNETQRQNFYEVRTYLQGHLVEILEKCDEVDTRVSPTIIEDTLDADKQMMSTTDFNNYGNELFAQERKKIEAFQKKQKALEDKQEKSKAIESQDMLSSLEIPENLKIKFKEVTKNDRHGHKKKR